VSKKGMLSCPATLVAIATIFCTTILRHPVPKPAHTANPIVRPSPSTDGVWRQPLGLNACLRRCTLPPSLSLPPSLPPPSSPPSLPVASPHPALVLVLLPSRQWLSTADSKPGDTRLLCDGARKCGGGRWRVEGGRYCMARCVPTVLSCCVCCPGSTRDR